MLALTKVQQEQLLLMRKNHLRALRQVYEERQRLNMQVGARKPASLPSSEIPVSRSSFALQSDRTVSMGNSEKLQFAVLLLKGMAQSLVVVALAKIRAGSLAS